MVVIVYQSHAMNMIYTYSTRRIRCARVIISRTSDADRPEGIVLVTARDLAHLDKIP